MGQYQVAKHTCNGNHRRRRERENRTDKILEEVITVNFPKLKTNNKLHIQETQRIPSRINRNSEQQHMPRPIILQTAKNQDKEKIMKAVRQRRTCYL